METPDPEMEWPAEALAPTDATKVRQSSVAVNAGFWIMDASAVPGLREAAVSAKNWRGRPKDGFKEYLRLNARIGPKYTGTGPALTALLGFFQKRGISLQTDEYRGLAEWLAAQRGGTAFVFAGTQGRKHLEILNPFLFLESDLRDYYNQTHGSSDLQIGKPMLDGVVAIRDCLRVLAPDSIALLMIG